VKNYAGGKRRASFTVLAGTVIGLTLLPVCATTIPRLGATPSSTAANARRRPGDSLRRRTVGE
jgi:hypothetical protein